MKPCLSKIFIVNVMIQIRICRSFYFTFIPEFYFTGKINSLVEKYRSFYQHSITLFEIIQKDSYNKNLIHAITRN